jgi:hypothetical protein
MLLVDLLAFGSCEIIFQKSENCTIIINHMKKIKFSKHSISEFFPTIFLVFSTNVFWKVWESFTFQRNFFGTKFANVLEKNCHIFSYYKIEKKPGH